MLLRISDVLDRCGDRDDATLLQVRALQLMSGNPGPRQPAHHRPPGLEQLAEA